MSIRNRGLMLHSILILSFISAKLVLYYIHISIKMIYIYFIFVYQTITNKIIKITRNNASNRAFISVIRQEIKQMQVQFIHQLHILHDIKRKTGDLINYFNLQKHSFTSVITARLKT